MSWVPKPQRPPLFRPWEKPQPAPSASPDWYGKFRRESNFDPETQKHSTPNVIEVRPIGAPALPPVGPFTHTDSALGLTFDTMKRPYPAPGSRPAPKGMRLNIGPVLQGVRRGGRGRGMSNTRPEEKPQSVVMNPVLSVDVASRLVRRQFHNYAVSCKVCEQNGPVNEYGFCFVCMFLLSDNPTFNPKTFTVPVK